MQFYRISGLSVASEIDLPGLIAGVPERAPQVTIRRGEVPENLPQPTASGPTWQIAGKQFLLRIPDIARFLLNDGREIVVAPESEAAAANLPIFTLGSAFGILLHQREQIVLHASAVRVGDKAVLFCGQSGAGKDTGQGAVMMVRKQGDWLAAKVGDELVMMSAEIGNYIGLSGVGARIWELIETPQEVDTVCARLLDEFEVTPDVCRSEVETFLNELVKHGAIALDPAPAG